MKFLSKSIEISGKMCYTNIVYIAFLYVNFGKGNQMSRFENKLCPVCRERFHDGDDIAVCPECGTPHHRACYLKNNKCALEELHSQGFVWNGRLPDEPLDAVLPPLNASVPPVFSVPEPVERKTSNLNDDLTDNNAAPKAADTNDNTEDSDNKDNKDTFEMLGLPDPNDDMFKEMGMSDPIKELYKMVNDGARGEDGVSMQELIAYTSTSIWHYSKAFRLFRGADDGKKRMTHFNICSGLFSPIFQFYRKMDVLGVFLLIISVLPTFLIMTLTNNDTAALELYNNLAGLLSFINITEGVLLCLFGDYLFYKKAVRGILKVRRSFDGDVGSVEYLKALSEYGRPSYAHAILGCLAMLFANACILTISGGVF